MPSQNTERGDSIWIPRVASLRREESPPPPTDVLETNLLSSKRDKRAPCDPVEAVVFFFRRLTDPENLHRFTTQVRVVTLLFLLFE